MNPLSSHQKTVSRLFFICLMMFLILYPTRTAAAQSDLTSHQRSFKRYGFIAVGFSSEQEAIIQSTLASFDKALGGRGRLARIIRTYHHGENWTITYVPDWTGADSSMKLSPTVFSIEKALASNYSSYGASDETMHAQIVIGHEISHLLLRAVRDRTGVKWANNYERQVTRDWTSIKDKKAPEEEAVTELSMKVLDTGYYFSVNQDMPETDPSLLTQIDQWTEDFLSTLQRLD